MQHKHIAVIGRIPHDDEDSCFIFNNMTLDESYQAFSDAIYKKMLSDSEPTALEACCQDNIAQEAPDRDVYITHVIVSDAPMKIMV